MFETSPLFHFRFWDDEISLNRSTIWDASVRSHDPGHIGCMVRIYINALITYVLLMTLLMVGIVIVYIPICIDHL